MKKARLWAVALLLTVTYQAMAQYDDDYYGYETRTTRTTYRSGYYDEGWSSFYIGYSPLKLSSDHSGVDDMSFNGFLVGYSYTQPFGAGPACFEGGFEAAGDYFSEKYDTNYGREKHSYEFYSAKLLANLAFRFDASDAIAFIPFAGLNAKVNISGEEIYKVGGQKETYNLFDDEDMHDSDFNRFQVGFQAGLKLMFQQSVYLEAAYTSDLTPVYSDNYEKQKFSGFRFVLGYSF